MIKIICVCIILLIIMVAGIRLCGPVIAGIEFDSVYKKATEYHDLDAQLMLAEFYNLGMWVEKNDSESIRWAKKAAYYGNRSAKDFLCNQYKIGCENG